MWEIFASQLPFFISILIICFVIILILAKGENWLEQRPVPYTLHYHLELQELLTNVVGHAMNQLRAFSIWVPGRVSQLKGHFLIGKVNNKEVVYMALEEIQRGSDSFYVLTIRISSKFYHSGELKVVIDKYSRSVVSTVKFEDAHKKYTSGSFDYNNPFVRTRREFIFLRDILTLLLPNSGVQWKKLYVSLE